jgi:hypothetical protein
MISSDLHGAEEPIRWTLGWQTQDRVYDEPMHERKRNALIRTSLALIVAYGDQHLADGVDHDGQDTTSDD